MKRMSAGIYDEPLASFHPVCQLMLGMGHNATEWTLLDQDTSLWSPPDSNITQWTRVDDLNTTGNMSLSADPEDVFTAKMRYKHIRQISYGYILPSILAFGIIGNTLNIAVFSQKRLWVQQDVMEKSAMIGLLSLAVADLLFCITGFPSAFIEVRYYIGQDDYSLSALTSLYYTTYRSGLLNVFVFMSTWFIITLSIERYFAVVHPFKAKKCITIRRTLIIKLIVIVLSFLINIPDFLRYSIQRIDCGSKTCTGCFYARPNPMLFDSTVVMVFSLIWHSTGTIFPLVLLTFCNIRLVMEIYRSVTHASRVSYSRQSHDTRTITVILILIITMFLLLVCPSMLLTFLTECVLNSAAAIQHYQIALIITNLSQALNFAINFLLYCAFSPKFRRGLRRFSCSKQTVASQSNDVVSGLI